VKSWQRIAGQVLLAVGGVLALGGIASFLFPTANIELRVWTGVVTTAEARLAWIVSNAALAVLGLWLLQRSKSP